ncbi:MAG TPA: hypothetical protein VKV95_10705 [Terriglobia bacterium]|nr:hypothetical protein [Terriglobia bacterium]
MILRLNAATQVENQRNYPAEIVERLRLLLIGGATAYADIHREDFYDVVDGPRVYFIHISPTTHNVILLATWLNESRVNKEKGLAGCAA